MQISTFDLLIIVIAVLSVLLVISFVMLFKQKMFKKAFLKQNKMLNEDIKGIKQKNQELMEVNKSYMESNETLREAKEKLEKLAFTDYLTELPNHTAFVEMLNTVTLTLRSSEIIAVMGIDIDDFKRINDVLGNTYGDQVLIDIANRLIDAIDENDFLARIGGDEFAVVSQNFNDLTSYEEKIKKMRKIFDYPFSLAGKEVFLTASMGITVVPRDGNNTKVLLKNISSAIFSAKSYGKNQYVYFDESINERLTEKLEIQSDLRKALDESQIKICYQARLELSTSRIKGLEMLLRWDHPQMGSLESSDFLPYAEETGLIIQIGRTLICESLKKLKEWHDKGYNDLRLSVNISKRQFKDNDFVKDMIDIIRVSGIEPRCLELAVTEQTAADDISYTIETMEKLRFIGISFSFCNFGTGYSTINYLKVLPVDSVKIDTSFINSLLSDNMDKSITESFIKLFKDMNMMVLLEGVELDKKEELLKAISGNAAIGYLYDRILTENEIEEMLKEAYGLLT